MLNSKMFLKIGQICLLDLNLKRFLCDLLNFLLRSQIKLLSLHWAEVCTEHKRKDNLQKVFFCCCFKAMEFITSFTLMKKMS